MPTKTTETSEPTPPQPNTKQPYGQSDLARFIRLMDRSSKEQVEFMRTFLAEWDKGTYSAWECAFVESARQLGMRHIPHLIDAPDRVEIVDQTCAVLWLGPDWFRHFIELFLALQKLDRMNNPEDLLGVAQIVATEFYNRVEMAKDVLRDYPGVLSEDIKKAANANPGFADFLKKGTTDAR